MTVKIVNNDVTLDFVMIVKIVKIVKIVNNDVTRDFVMIVKIVKIVKIVNDVNIVHIVQVKSGFKCRVLCLLV